MTCRVAPQCRHARRGNRRRFSPCPIRCTMATTSSSCDSTDRASARRSRGKSSGQRAKGCGIATGGRSTHSGSAAAGSMGLSKGFEGSRNSTFSKRQNDTSSSGFDSTNGSGGGSMVSVALAVMAISTRVSSRMRERASNPNSAAISAISAGPPTSKARTKSAQPQAPCRGIRMFSNCRGFIEPNRSDH